MQSTFLRWLCLTLCCLAVAGCVRRVPRAKVQSKDQTKPATAVAAAKSATPTWQVQGWGKTADDAEQHAVKNAREKVISYLHRLDPPVLWEPSLDYVRENLWTAQPERCPDQEKVQIEGEQMQCWSWPVSVTTAQLEKIRKEDVRYRVQLAAQERMTVAQERMQELGKLVGWVFLALVGVSLYIRIDRWTEATHRRWLRLGLSSIIIACGLWWLLY